MTLTKLFPKGVASILDFFLAHPKKRYSRRELERAGLAPRTLDRHLKRLTDEGILKFKQVKNRHYYSLNASDKTAALNSVRKLLAEDVCKECGLNYPMHDSDCSEVMYHPCR